MVDDSPRHGVPGRVTSLGVFDPPLSFYGSVQDADLDDTAFLWRIHVGADYLLNPLSNVGLRLSWSASEEIEASGGYQTHPMHETEPAFMNTTVFSDRSNWTLMLAYRRVIGN